MMERLTEKQSSGYDLKAMNGEWCNKYCEKQIVQTCNECVIYQAIHKLAEYEDFEEKLNGVSVKQVVDGFIKAVENQTNEEYERGRILTNAEADKWNEYKQLDKQGLLLRLPAEAYFIKDNIVRKGWVQELVYSPCTKLLLDIRYDDNSLDSYRGYLGNDVFLTQAEAEQKLKEMESDRGVKH